MEDPHFFEREKLFDDQTNQLIEIIDSAAKRMRSMQHYAYAALKSFLEIGGFARSKRQFRLC